MLIRVHSWLQLPRRRVKRRCHQRTREIVRQVLLRIEWITWIDLQHPALGSHRQGRAPLDKFVHTANAKRQQRHCDPEPPAGQSVEPAKGAIQHEPGDEPEVKVDEQIELESEEGRGSTFRLVLPAEA